LRRRNTRRAPGTGRTHRLWHVRSRVRMAPTREALGQGRQRHGQRWLTSAATGAFTVSAPPLFAWVSRLTSAIPPGARPRWAPRVMAAIMQVQKTICGIHRVSMFPWGALLLEARSLLAMHWTDCSATLLFPIGLASHRERPCMQPSSVCAAISSGDNSRCPYTTVMMAISISRPAPSGVALLAVVLAASPAMPLSRTCAAVRAKRP
jgi:hypothetical protein